jgi:hypothetical protein
LQLTSRPWLAAGWLVSRAFVLAMTALHFEGDVGTYFRQGGAWWAGQVPYRDYGVEYPPAAVAVFALLASAGSYAGFRALFLGLALALDALCFGLLLRREQRTGVWCHVAATALLFPVLYVRYDLMPAAATLGACLLLQPLAAPDGGPDGLPAGERLSPGQALGGGALLGLGVAFKLYPLLLVPFLLLVGLRGRSRVRALVGVGASAAAVVGLSFLPALAAGAGPAVLSFLRYQGERGLQIESSYAALLMVVQAIVPLGLHHQPSHAAHDLAGPLASAIAPATRWLQAAAVLGVSWLAGRRRLPLARAAAAVVAAALVTANVFSPQFLIWLVPLVALALPSVEGDRLSGWLLVAAAALTALIFPALYPRLLQGRADAALALLLRNGLIAVLAVRLCAPVGYRGRTC